MQAASLKLLSPSLEDARLVKLVAEYSGIELLDVVEGSKEVQLITPSGQTLTGSNTICKHIAKSSSKAANLLGSNPEDEALVGTSDNIMVQWSDVYNIKNTLLKFDCH